MGSGKMCTQGREEAIKRVGAAVIPSREKAAGANSSTKGRRQKWNFPHSRVWPRIANITKFHCTAVVYARCENQPHNWNPNEPLPARPLQKSLVRHFFLSFLVLWCNRWWHLESPRFRFVSYDDFATIAGATVTRVSVIQPSLKWR